MMLNKAFGSVSLSRKSRVLSLATVTDAIKVRDEVVPVNPQALFMRLVWVINRDPGSLSKYLSYELATRPPALFDDISMRKNAKSTLLEVFESFPASELPLEDSQKVVDGGYLLRALVWPKPATFGALIEAYIRHVIRHYSKDATVIFDGYSEQMSTKTAEQKRRASKRTSPNIHFDLQTTVTVPQADFLSNSQNKARLINLLSQTLESEGVRVRQAIADADALIVKTALDIAREKNKVVVVGTDTDLLIMLLARARKPDKIYFLSPGSKAYNVGSIQNTIGERKQCLLFIHAMSGCDTTSALFGKGKKKAWKLSINKDVQKISAIFCTRTSSKESVAKAGEKFIMMLYESGKNSEPSLDDLRCRIYARTLAKKSVTSNFELASLPPTSAAARQHSLRTYLQVPILKQNTSYYYNHSLTTQMTVSGSRVARELPSSY